VVPDEQDATVDRLPASGSGRARWLLVAMVPVALCIAVPVALLSLFVTCGYDGCGPDWRSTQGPYGGLAIALESAGLLVVPFLAIPWASRPTQKRVAGIVAAAWWIVLAILIFWPKAIVPNG
jgi:hypothetical protein